MQSDVISTSPSIFHPSRSAIFRDARDPRDYTHRAMLRDTDPRVFELLRRHPSLAGFRSCYESDGVERRLWLRRGPSAPTRIALLGSGCWGMLVSHFDRIGQGSVTLSRTTPGAVIASLLLLAVGAWIVLRKRKYIALVAQPSGHGGTDMWIAGASSHRSAEFDAEFDALVEEARRMHAEFNRAIEARRAPGGPRSNAA
jgi:hypothetical protein